MDQPFLLVENGSMIKFNRFIGLVVYRRTYVLLHMSRCYGYLKELIYIKLVLDLLLFGG